jgi:hypothetical protein
MGISLAARHWATGVAAHPRWAAHPTHPRWAAHPTHPWLTTIAAHPWLTTIAAHPWLTTIAAHPWLTTMPIPSPHTRVRKLLICLAKLPLFLLFLI